MLLLHHKMRQDWAGNKRTQMRRFLRSLKLGTLTLGGFALIVLGAAGYATFAETTHSCVTENST